MARNNFFLKVGTLCLDYLPDRVGGRGTIKAERVCRLVLPGELTCSLRIGGLVAPPVGLRMKGAGSQKVRSVGSLLDNLRAGEKLVFNCMRVGQLSHYSQVLLLPLGVLPLGGACMLHMRSSQDSEVWRVHHH